MQAAFLLSGRWDRIEALQHRFDRILKLQARKQEGAPSSMSSKLRRPPALSRTQCWGPLALTACLSEVCLGEGRSTRAMSCNGCPTVIMDSSLTTARCKLHKCSEYFKVYTKVLNLHPSFVALSNRKFSTGLKLMIKHALISKLPSQSGRDRSSSWDKHSISRQWS